MKLFFAHSARPYKYQFDGAHTWVLPSRKCEVCKTPRYWSIGNPKFTIEGKLDPKPYTSARPVSPERFQELVEPLDRLRSPEWPPFRPGMAFGPFLGKVMHKEKRDFLWIFGRHIAIREECYEKLQNEGIELETGPAIIRDTKTMQPRPDYTRMVVARPIECMSPETLAHNEFTHCSGCGIRLITPVKRLILDCSLIPSDLHIFSAVWETQKIIVSEAFCLAAEKLKLTNIAFEPVEVVNL